MSANVLRQRPRALALIVASLVLGALVLTGQPASAAYNPSLQRYPYLTDLTSSSVQVSWATNESSKGIVRWGTAGNCAANAVQSATLGSPITVSGTKEYQLSVKVSGLSPNATYCYRVYTGASVDLMGTDAPGSFTTLQSPGDSSGYTFDVFGDWGDTNWTNGALNTGQANVMASMASSGARFVLGTGDIAYANGSQDEYGDLVHPPTATSPDLGEVFGPSYWANVGEYLPLFTTPGNHGRSATFFSNWKEPTVVAASGGTYGMVSYPNIDGTAGTYPAAWYAFSTGNARFYILDADWADTIIGTASSSYQVERDQHWQTSSPEYQWLAADLAANPGVPKFVVFHYPLRSDDPHEPSDTYLQNTAGNPNSLEQLLAANGPVLVFNGHAHIYERNVAPPGGVFSYVTGGGGAKSSVLQNCSSTDAYAVGWASGSGSSYACGGAPKPTSNLQVFHYLKVSVSGTSVTVTPIDANGNSFDVQTYNMAPDATAPSVVPNVAAVYLAATSQVRLTWGAASDNTGVEAYDVYRNGVYLATVDPAVGTASRPFYDSGVAAGAVYTYSVVARDLAGNTGQAGTAQIGGETTVTVAPSADASISALNPTVNYGSATTLTVDKDNDQNDFLLRFPVPAACTPTSAKLTLTAGSASNSGSGKGGNFYATGDGWTEAGVNAGNAPAAAGTPVSLGAVALNTSYTLDVSSLLTAGVSNGNFDLRASTTSTDAAIYVSKDASNGATAGPSMTYGCQ